MSRSWCTFIFWGTLCHAIFLFCVVEAISSENQFIVKVYFFDVGQGDAIFVDTIGNDILIDGGPLSASSTLLGYLSGLGVSEIAYVVATHPHEDHIGGLISVLNSSISIDVVLYNGESARASQVYQNFMSLAKTKIAIAKRGQTYVLCENVNFTILNPVHPLEFKEVNSNSVVLRLQVGNVAFLFTGDATFEAEGSMMKAGLNFSSQVLKVAHHGSRYATSEAFLEAVNPSFAVISASISNPYGHPHEETVNRLLNKGITVYGTYVSGTIVMGTDGQTIYVCGSPTPIPEFPQNMILCFMLALTILITFAGKERLYNHRG